MENTKVSIKVAQKEVGKWLDYKKVDEKKRTENEEGINNIAEAISSGYLSYDESTHVFVQELKFPIGEGAAAVKTLEYKARLKMSEIHSRTRNVKSADTYGLITAYVCALTGQATGIIGGLDSEDNRIGQAIALFFL